MPHRDDFRPNLLNISLPMVTNFNTVAILVGVLPNHPFPFIVAPNADKPEELVCVDVYGNPSTNHTYKLRNGEPRPVE